MFDINAYDFGYVNILDAAGGVSLVDQWKTFEGDNGAYQAVSLDLPAAALGQPIMIEFQMTSDPAYADGTREGWYLDDVGVYP